MPTVEELINAVEQRSPAGSPLERVSAAADLSRELAGLGDQVADHFVAEARAAGASWSEIGAALGVSKQAAQQRFSVRGLLARLRPNRFVLDARRMVELADEEALALGHGHVGTEHLLLALARSPETAGGRMLATAGISHEAVRARVVELLGPCNGERPKRLRFTPRAKRALEDALREARDVGDSYIGSEHLLLGLLRHEDAVAPKVLRDLGAPPERLRELVTAARAQAA